MQHCENLVDHLSADDKGELYSVEEEIGRITTELSELAKFSRLNYTGFIKILKKHDKYTDYMLKPMFMLRLKSRPLYLENSDNLIYRLSKLYDRIRSGNPSQKPYDTAQQRVTEGQVFVRNTSKYWVHTDNVTEVKCFILKYLPVLIYPSKKRKLDLAVSSVYLDNESMELYKGRLEKSEGAIAIRIRWYGSDEPREVFIERKVHREDWTGEISVKARFPLKAKYVNGFLAGTFTPDDVVRKLDKEKHMKDTETENLRTLAKEIQNAIQKQNLRPTIRTFYNRTAFQLPGDSRVRISLDTDLCMIREDGSKRSGKHWKREDVDASDFPFDLPSSELTRFPHAVLEVKLQSHAGQDPPKWSNDLISSHLVEEVPKFSKFIHGCATLFPSVVPLVPFWLPQMDVDIRKPAPLELEDDSEDVGSSEGASSTGKEPMHTNKVKRLVSQNDKTSHVAISIKGYDNNNQNLLDENASLLGKKASKGSGFLGFFSRSNKVSPEDDGGRSQHLRDNRLGNNRRIYIPVRVEPKVFFANERTFLSWIHFSIFLGGIATALVGLGNHTARISGYLFGGVSVLFTAYALYLYQWRAGRIRERDPGPYDDRIGPVVIVLVFVVAMVMNMIFAAITD